MSLSLEERKANSAKEVDKVPLFNFAVFSKRDGQQVCELESSWEDRSKAENAFKNFYSTWGMTDTTFYLVDWENQVVLQQFKYGAKA